MTEVLAQRGEPRAGGRRSTLRETVGDRWMIRTGWTDLMPARGAGRPLRWVVLLFVVVACQAPVARADRVVPNAGVTNPVPVRSTPSSDATKVGDLSPGENADLVASVPRWYEVRLTNGV